MFLSSTLTQKKDICLCQVEAGDYGGEGDGPERATSAVHVCLTALQHQSQDRARPHLPAKH